MTIEGTIVIFRQMRHTTGSSVDTTVNAPTWITELAHFVLFKHQETQVQFRMAKVNFDPLLVAQWPHRRIGRCHSLAGGDTL